MHKVTDTVISVSGSLNEVLTMTNTSMTVNGYKGWYIEWIADDDMGNYLIASNTASTITLDISSAIDDLSGVEINIIRNYVLLAQLKKRVTKDVDRGDNATWQDALATDSELIDTLKEIDEDINGELMFSDITVNTEHTQFWRRLGKIEIDVALMHVMRGSRFRKNNSGEDAARYWEITPDFTFEHKKRLAKTAKLIARANNNSTNVYDMNTREVINL